MTVSSPGFQARAEPADAPPGRAAYGLADELIDELLPESLEWRRLVRRYPMPALAVAAAFGFFVGKNHGSAIVAAVGAFAGRQATRAVEQLLGEDGEEAA